ncbi:hypothetical protein ACPA9J_35035 [Pseudomonas aeruginosa]
MQTGIGRCCCWRRNCTGTRRHRAPSAGPRRRGAAVSAAGAPGSACCFEPGGQQHPPRQRVMTAAGLAVPQTVLEPGFLEQVREQGATCAMAWPVSRCRYGHGPLRGRDCSGAAADRPALAMAAVVRAAFGRPADQRAAAALPAFFPGADGGRANVDNAAWRLGGLARVADTKEWPDARPGGPQHVPSKAARGPALDRPPLQAGIASTPTPTCLRWTASSLLVVMGEPMSVHDEAQYPGWWRRSV